MGEIKKLWVAGWQRLVLTLPDGAVDSGGVNTYDKATHGTLQDASNVQKLNPGAEVAVQCELLVKQCMVLASLAQRAGVVFSPVLRPGAPDSGKRPATPLKMQSPLGGVLEQLNAELEATVISLGDCVERCCL